MAMVSETKNHLMPLSLLEPLGIVNAAENVIVPISVATIKRVCPIISWECDEEAASSLLVLIRVGGVTLSCKRMIGNGCVSSI